MGKSDLLRACDFLALPGWGFKLDLIICLKRYEMCRCQRFLLSLTTWLRFICRHSIKVIWIFQLFLLLRHLCVHAHTDTHIYTHTCTKHAHTNGYMGVFMKSGRFGDESPLLLLQMTHSLPRTILYIKWTMESYFPRQTEMLYFKVGSCISKPEICMKDICTVPSGQVFN